MGRAKCKGRNAKGERSETRPRSEAHYTLDGSRRREADRTRSRGLGDGRRGMSVIGHLHSGKRRVYR